MPFNYSLICNHHHPPMVIGEGLRTTEDVDSAMFKHQYKYHRDQLYTDISTSRKLKLSHDLLKEVEEVLNESRGSPEC